MCYPNLSIRKKMDKARNKNLSWESYSIQQFAYNFKALCFSQKSYGQFKSFAKLKACIHKEQQNLKIFRCNQSCTRSVNNRSQNEESRIRVLALFFM